MATSNRHHPETGIPTQRIEAFSDGVIAIAITVMVFDLKLGGVPTEDNVWDLLQQVGPKFVCYVLSFIMLGIMWVNHHQLFHQIVHSDRKLLWYSMHLLFWMSLVPFCTNFVGANPLLPHASLCYGLVFFGNAMAFTLLRTYAYRAGIVHAHVSERASRRARIKNWIAMGTYLIAAFASFVSVYVSFSLFLLVPTMYFVPERVLEDSQHHSK
ncbi:MAG: hypothetical protein RLZZ165_907 [Bacteroidota bacterium]|jgi:uncharacterized membrane protein